MDLGRAALGSTDQRVADGCGPERLLTIKEDYEECANPSSASTRSPDADPAPSARGPLVPISRMVVGPNLSNGIIHVSRAFGRVDLKSGDRKFLLFRSQREPSDSWVIVEDEGFTVKTFDRALFEEAMQSLLQ